MSFFDGLAGPAPDREPPRMVEHRRAPWEELAPNVVPATVALDVLLARTERLAVWVGDAVVGPRSAALVLTVVAKDPLDGPRPHGDLRGLRFGVGFADGRRAVADHPPRGHTRPEGDAQREIALWPRGGTGGRRRHEQRHILWPLPPAGPLTLALAWPQQGIGETTAAVDSALLREAASRVVELWPDDRPPPPEDPGAGWLRYAGS